MFEFLRLLKKWFSTEKFQFSFAIDQITLQQNKNSYSFKMGYGGAGLDALLLGDPLELEGWEGGQDGATDPWSISSLVLIFVLLGARPVISLCMRSAKPGSMLEPPDRTMFLTQVNIKLHYGAEEGVADAYSGKTHITGMTESLSAQEPLFADGDQCRGPSIKEKDHLVG